MKYFQKFSPECPFNPLDYTPPLRVIICAFCDKAAINLLALKRHVFAFHVRLVHYNLK